MCTGIFTISNDGICYQSRTLEFELILNYKKIIKNNIIGSALNGKYFIDGMNNHGLCVMSFYFKCSVSYNPELIQKKINLPSHEVCGYFLNNSKSVSDVIKVAKHVNVTQEPFPAPFNGVIPLHWFISDNKGNTIVVEANNGKLIVYNNSKYKVCTNNPTYPEQVEDLKNLIKKNRFTSCNPVNNLHCGLGKGLIGIPGDYSSFGRFARAYLLSKEMIVPGYNISNIDTLFHFLNNFDIVYGSTKDCSKTSTKVDFTQYTIIYDLTNLTAYYKTYKDQKIRKFGSLKRL